jgi:hypothetical protein
VSSVLVPVRSFSALVVGFVIDGERTFLISGFFQILIRGKAANQNHKNSCYNKFRKNIFIKTKM